MIHCAAGTANAAATAQATGSTPLKAHSVLGQEACCTAAAATLHDGSTRGRTHTLRTTALHCTQRRRAASCDATSCRKNQPEGRAEQHSNIQYQKWRLPATSHSQTTMMHKPSWAKARCSKRTPARTLPAPPIPLLTSLLRPLPFPNEFRACPGC